MKNLSPETLRRGSHRLCRLVLGGIFIYAASQKIATPQELADSIASYHLVPQPLISLMALGLPLFELVCGLLLLTGYFCATGLLSIISLLIVFLAALLTAVVRGISVDCGCFGPQAWLDANPWLSLLRDSALLLCAIYAYRQRLTLELTTAKRQEPRVAPAVQ